jgi:glycosidase
MQWNRGSLSGTALAVLVLAASACSKSSSSAGPLLHVPSPSWEEQVIYFVMTDRYANGDPANDDQKRGEYDPSTLDKYSGGDLQGIIDKLDYIQGLGATAVWITPPVANMWWDPLQQSGGYHGYWARHLKRVDEHLGTLDTYKALSAALHARGMYLIQDVVPNHMGNYFQYSAYDPLCTPVDATAACVTGPAIASCDVTKGLVRNTAAAPGSKPEQSPFDQDDPADPVQRAAAIYHWTPAISDYNNACQEASYQISDLDDLNTENPVVRKALRDSYGYWIKEVGVDAFRVDTAKFVPHDFWNDFFHSTDAEAPGMMSVAKSTGRDGFFAFGEVFETPDPMTDTLERKVASYLGTPAKPELPSVLGFPLYGEIGRVFAGGEPTSYMTYRLGKLMDPSLYPNPNVVPTFMDNHDVRRFLSISSPTGEDLLQALSFLFTVPGIPVVYYGTEQGFDVPRKAMFKGGWKGDADAYGTTGAVYERVKKLSGLRRASKVFTHGALDVVYDSVGGAGPFAFRRTQGAETALVLMNTSTKRALVASLDTKLAAGSTLEVLHDEGAPATPVVGPGGRITMELPPKAVIVARATGQVVAPPAPGATIALSTPVDGRTFTADLTLTGSVSPAGTRLQMVLDGNLAQPTPVTVAADGSFSVLLPVSGFATGSHQHDLAIYAPDVKVATPSARFTADVVFSGQTYTFADPVGDDRGPIGTYTYPSDATFKHQMDITSVKVEVGPASLNLTFTMADVSTVWNPPNGFDHVAFNVYLAVPGLVGATVMPKLNATTPPGFAWTYAQFAYGFDPPSMFSAAGATADAYGPPVKAPKVKADLSARTITFTYDRNDYGLSTWSGVKVYAATWDFDGIGGAFRPLTKDGGQWRMGGGGPPYTPDATDPALLYSADPKVMDDIAVITIP